MWYDMIWDDMIWYNTEKNRRDDKKREEDEVKRYWRDEKRKVTRWEYLLERDEEKRWDEIK